jgi:hypothetical protein
MMAAAHMRTETGGRGGPDVRKGPAWSSRRLDMQVRARIDLADIPWIARTPGSVGESSSAPRHPGCPERPPESRVRRAVASRVHRYRRSRTRDHSASAKRCTLRPTALSNHPSVRNGRTGRDDVARAWRTRCELRGVADRRAQPVASCPQGTRIVVPPRSPTEGENLWTKVSGECSRRLVVSTSRPNWPILRR